ncbi:S8 family peptidase [Sinanaerobacter chloroacetimidivorans]|uniref:S8 family peptidase n=1 Tax=Sinanaerobacter chloroacetimidivorans TaxID=2818044 RepID=A0A8J7W668_9FIRM|nr:S8 family peptidase [Sinanaerobacter chloroacetimidivorans]MBR0599776.1 S8 family peptidase [Sinanaerobacter chloroacetimidivorans]
MNDQDKFHLWIPSGEVTKVLKKPTSRNKNYGLNPAEHGSKLSKGLQDILDIFNKLKAGDSLHDEDIMTFKVVLQDGEDFSNRKKLMEDEGLKINAVKDSRHAIVSAKKDVFDRLQGRIGRYRDRGTVKDFQYIDDFEPFSSRDKQSASLIRYFQENKDQIAVDVQMMLLPNLGNEIQKKAEKKLVEKIINKNGSLPADPFQLTDGTTIIRALVPMSSFNEIADDQAIYRIEQTVFFLKYAPSVSSPFGKGLQLKPGVIIEELPAVVILDDGVDFPKNLAQLVPIHWRATGCNRPVFFGSHGTPVASRAAFENLGLCISDENLTPRVKIIDANIIDGEKTASNIVIQRIREAVITFSPIAKIFNFSYNAQQPIDGDEMSFLGCELDLLTKAYGVRFVLSAGNHQLVFSEDNLKDILDDDDSRIAEPADAMLGITVGAVVGHTHNGSISKENDIAPYSRKGPGFCGFYKPDLVAYGATQFKNGIAPSDPYALCLSNTGYCALPGTSFTAPTVAGDLAQILPVVPNEDIGLAQALLYNGVIPLFENEGITQEEAEYAGNLYGRGLSAPRKSMYSSEDKISFLHTGTLNRLTKQRVKFHIPTILADAKVKRGDDKARVTVTCIVQPPIDRTKGSEYSGAYIQTSIHRLNSNGKNVVDNPDVSDNRNKWDSCYHFSNTFSSFCAGSWEIWLELFTRWGVEDNDEIPYSLVITIEDLTQAGNLYTEIIKETAGRFTPVQPVRLTVK